MKSDLLLKLATELENNPEDLEYGWDFSTWCQEPVGGLPDPTAGCGTAGCAVNRCRKLWPEQWTRNKYSGFPVLSEDGAYPNRERNYSEIPLLSVMKFFELTKTEAKLLFQVTWLSKWYSDAKLKELTDLGFINIDRDATPAAVANNIRVFVQYKESLNASHQDQKDKAPAG